MSRLWENLKNTESIARIQSFTLLLVIVILQSDSYRSEHISIAIKENENWEALFDYEACGLNMAGMYCTSFDKGIHEASSWIEELDVEGSRDGGEIYFKGQGYQTLEMMLDRSQCCGSPQIAVHTNNNVQQIYFTLTERGNHNLDSWSVSLKGEDIISSNEIEPGEESGIAWWHATHLSENRSSNQSGVMEAILTASDEGLREGGIVFIHEGWEGAFFVLIFAPSLVILLLMLLFVRKRGQVITRFAGLFVGGVVGWVVGVLLAYATVPYEEHCVRASCDVSSSYLLSAYPLVMISIAAGMIIVVVVLRHIYGKRINSGQTSVLSE